MTQLSSLDEAAKYIKKLKERKGLTSYNKGGALRRPGLP
jgi:hypothetical protein